MSTITDDQIAALRAEAASAGDHAMVAICRVALHDETDELPRAGCVTPAAARAECARVIADAHAQEGR